MIWIKIGWFVFGFMSCLYVILMLNLYMAKKLEVKRNTPDKRI